RVSACRHLRGRIVAGWWCQQHFNMIVLELAHVVTRGGAGLQCVAALVGKRRQIVRDGDAGDASGARELPEHVAVKPLSHSLETLAESALTYRQAKGIGDSGDEIGEAALRWLQSGLAGVSELHLV